MRAGQGVASLCPAGWEVNVNVVYPLTPPTAAAAAATTHLGQVTEQNAHGQPFVASIEGRKKNLIICAFKSYFRLELHLKSTTV